MSITITRTKIIQPSRRSDLITRPRLLEAMDDLLDYRLTLVTAPAGYGKTSLLVDLAEKIDVPVCWLALDPLDQDLYRFLVHFVAAIRNQFPEFGENSLSLIRGLGQQDQEINRLVRTIVNDAYEHIQEHFVLVLDDYHLIDKNQQINQFISQFGQEVDENCHLVIASRTLLDLPDLPLMVGRSQVKGLSFEELAFQPREIQRLLERNYGRNITAREAARLAEETEGWITGLLLSAEIAPEEKPGRTGLSRASGVDLYDYLAEQVLDQQSAGVRDFMLKTCLLEEFDADLCRAVLGDPPPDTSWPDLIRTILHENLFVIPVDSQGTWIRYHHLYRDFLQTRFHQSRPAEEQLLLQKLVDHHTELHHWEKAYQYGSRLGDQELLADLIENAGAELMKDGRLRLLRSWIDALPDHILANHPGLLSRYGAVTTVLGDPRLGLTYLEQAEKIIRPEDSRLQLAKNLVWQASAHRFLGSHQLSLEKSLRAAEISGQDGIHLPVRAQANKAAGLAYYRRGRTAKALQKLQESIAIYNDLDDSRDAALTTMDLGLVYMQSGRYTKAAGLFQQALSTWLDTNHIAYQAGLYNNLGVLHHRTGRYLQAYEHFQQAVRCARQSGYLRMEAYALTSLGDLYFDLQAVREARRAYQQALSLASAVDDRFLIRTLEIMDARICRSNQDYHRAHLILSGLEQDLKDHGADQELGTWHLEKGLLDSQENQASSAASHFARAHELLSGETPNTDSIRAQLYQSWALDLTEQSDLAVQVLDQALQQAAGLETAHSLIPTALDIQPYLEQVLPEHPTSMILEKLIELCKSFEDRLPDILAEILPELPATAGKPEPDLTVKALGRPEVLRRGQPVQAPEWVNQKSARDLLFYLLAAGGELSKAAIARDLWPESNPESHKRKFKNAVYRLRRALGKDIVLYNQRSGLYTLNRELTIRYDVEDFQEACRKGLAAGDPRDRMELLNAAVQLYSHPYLAGRDGLWVEPVRNELTLQYYQAALTLAEELLDAGSHSQALDTCRAVLDIDPCQEDAHRLLMRIHAARGDRSAVARQYRLCREAFARVLDGQPSDQTSALYRSLIS